MAKNCSCSCSSAPKLIFACSGAADVGAIADQAARILSESGDGIMSCLAGIGGRVPGIMKSTEAASDVLVIDGCPLNCGKKCFEEAGFKDFKHIQLADLGLAKGESPVTTDRLDRVIKRAREMLGAEECV